jgi:hypothetical protein
MHALFTGPVALVLEPGTIAAEEDREALRWVSKGTENMCSPYVPSLFAIEFIEYLNYAVLLEKVGTKN